MVFLQTAEGQVTVDPEKVDEAAIAAWQKIYEGNSEDHIGLATNFIRQYRNFIFISDRTHSVAPFTKEMIQNDCRHASNTAPGWDQWQRDDWKDLSDTAAQRLADLLNAIEQGLDWPEPVSHGRAHLLAKDEVPSLSAMDYRLLLVLQRIYRRWGTMRLQHLQTPG